MTSLLPRFREFTLDVFCTGNPLPHKITWNADSAQFKNTFVVVGGHNGKAALDTLYRYNPDDDAWTLLPSRLTVPRWDNSAFPVNMNAFKKCD